MSVVYVILTPILYLLESAGILFASTVFLKKKPKFKVILINCLIGGIVIYILRKIPITFGFHTILAIIYYTLILSINYKVNYLNSFLGVLFSFILLTVFEIITFQLIINLTDYAVEDIIGLTGFSLLAIVPQILLLFLTGVLFLKWQKRKDKDGLPKDSSVNM